jgi:23S rRNA (cytidine1920-2'-O)/16S rRNA (cytidine1409-2'-O)-methyltransferase
MARVRADLLLVARGLAESRAKARAAIEAGGVTAAGAIVGKPSDLVDEDSALTLRPPHPWVSRAGVKLAHALAAFGVDVRDRICLDIGASTGGFTQVLLAHGAARVYAVDVGRDQLHASLRNDPRVVRLEQADARALTRTQIPEAPTLVTCDVSFIGAAKALTAPLTLAAAHADLVVLIKPQFESGPSANKTGVLSEKIAREIAARVAAELDGGAGFELVEVIDSPLRGGDGNLERVAHLRR